jgi:hypothetical protein
MGLHFCLQPSVSNFCLQLGATVQVANTASRVPAVVRGCFFLLLCKLATARLPAHLA